MNKGILLMDLETVRIWRVDALNVYVEQLIKTKGKKVKNKETGETETKAAGEKWAQFGFYPNMSMALKQIHNYGLLTGENKMTLREYMEQQATALRRIEQAVRNSGL